LVASLLADDAEASSRVASPVGRGDVLAVGGAWPLDRVACGRKLVVVNVLASRLRQKALEAEHLRTVAGAVFEADAQAPKPNGRSLQNDPRRLRGIPVVGGRQDCR